jgi:hypothetical protein
MLFLGAMTLGLGPDAGLGPILRRAGLPIAPAWLRSEPSTELQWLRWETSPRSGAGPDGVVLATMDSDRMAADLAPLLGDAWREIGDDALLGTRCRRTRLGDGVLVLAEPLTEGYAAACLARFGEGPIAVAVGATTAPREGRQVSVNPVNDGMATYLRLGSGTAPMLILLQAA